MKKISILGAGMIGRTMAIELSKKYKVKSFDFDPECLEFLSGRNNIETAILDVTDSGSMADAIRDADLVISAVPGFLGLETMIKVINQKKNLVDISFMAEDVLYLDPIAKKNDVTVIMDCGVAPGLPNYVIGYYNERMNLRDVRYYVGGLPKARNFPFEYKAPFSPKDVIEEYMRPARYIENGNLIISPAMSDAELIDFDKIGTLEAFNTDGLRSLIYTMKGIPSMKEKTLRYSGHIKLIQALKSSGFFDTKMITIGSHQIMPFELTSKILFDKWKLGNDEPEFTVLRIVLKGIEKGEPKEIVYELYDEFDTKEKTSSMARTTGFTATATAEMVLDKKFTGKGIFPPELVGKYPECYHFVISYLNERNINFTVSERIPE
jgi:lysine 6-dehydrogenase